MAVVEGCPAFANGCPFSMAETTALPIMGAVHRQKTHACIRETCPAFQKGCPFISIDSVETLYNKLTEMPASHQLNQSTTAANAVSDILHLVHTKSASMKSNFKLACPVFTTSCPFKTITTYGENLVSELDTVVERWGLQTSPGARSSQLESTALPLSKNLKAGTKIVHRSAENVHFVRDFLKGTVSKDSYINLLRALYYVYNALETALDALPSNLQHCDFARLKRAPGLKQDICDYLGSGELSQEQLGEPSLAAQQYVDRINELARERPALLLAHAYTRYLGDLSGGQILARAASKAYNLPNGAGIAFYCFHQIGDSASDIKAFKKDYRASLDALLLEAAEADAIVREANMAFLLNIMLFEERDVAAGHLKETRTLEEISQLVDAHKSPLDFQKAYNDDTAPSRQCPFIPGPAGRRAPGQPSFHATEEIGVCPWPFVWLHDPKSAVVVHPRKNVLGVLALGMLARAAWKHPVKCLIASIGAVITMQYLRPKKSGKDEK